MGNCQAAEAATVIIEHPGGRVERVYWSLSAGQVMASNPGYYVAAIITTIRSEKKSSGGGGGGNNAMSVRYQKLLRPSETLHIGGVYRLVSYEEVLNEFSSKHARLGRLVVEHKAERSQRKERRRRRPAGCSGGDATATATVTAAPPPPAVEQEPVISSSAHGGHVNSSVLVKNGQWRPTLQSIAEVGI